MVGPTLFSPAKSSGLRLSLAPAPNRRRGEGQDTEAEAVGRRLGHRGQRDRIVREAERPEAGVRTGAVGILELVDVDGEDVADVGVITQCVWYLLDKSLSVIFCAPPIHSVTFFPVISI